MLFAFETYTGDVLEAYTQKKGISRDQAKVECRENLVVIYQGYQRTAPTDQIVDSLLKATTR